MAVEVSICRECGHVFEGAHLVLCKTCLQNLGKGVWESMNEDKLWKVAEDILTLFEDNGFTTDRKLDFQWLKGEIVAIIKFNVEEKKGEK